jgi:hypothetical protein
VEPLPVEEELVVDEAPPPPVAAPVAPPRSPFADGDRRSKPAERAMPFMAMAGPLEFAAPINLRNVPVPEEREPVAPPPPEPVEKVAPVQEIEPEEIAVEEEVSTAGGELELASEELIEAMPTEQLVGDDLMDDRVARDVPTELPVEEIAVDSE